MAVLEEMLLHWQMRSVEGEPLLVKVMEKGKLSYNLPSLEQIRAAASENLSKLPEEYKVVDECSSIPCGVKPKTSKPHRNHKVSVN